MNCPEGVAGELTGILRVLPSRRCWTRFLERQAQALDAWLETVPSDERPHQPCLMQASAQVRR